MQKLLDYCPAVSSPSSGEEDLPGPSCVLHDRALSAVVALGRLAVETRLKVAGDNMATALLTKGVCGIYSLATNGLVLTQVIEDLHGQCQLSSQPFVSCYIVRADCKLTAGHWHLFQANF